MTTQSSHIWRKTPILSAALLAAYAIAFGYSPNLGLLLFFLTPLILLPLMVVWGVAVFRAFKVRDRRRECYLAIAIALAAPALSVMMGSNHDQIRFLAWRPFHRDLLDQNPDLDGIVAKWEVWGGIGWSNASYLARDVTDRIGSLDKANIWGQHLGLSCEIVRTQRVWPKLYVVTTSDCEL